MKNKTAPNYYAELHADRVYHVYNRTNNRELLFRSDQDRKFFLKRYTQFISPFAATYAYSLLPTHFHFMIKVKSHDVIAAFLQKLDRKEQTKPQIAFLDSGPANRTVHRIMENQFLRLFTSYAVVFNRRHYRKGNLFNRPFKRVAVENENHFTYLLSYIHWNPQKHGVVADFRKYFWSSYHAFLSKTPTRLLREEVLEWFGGEKPFIQFHQKEKNYEEISELVIEE